jgi:long-chain-fatty-acid--CoA ligase ACSBG
MFGRHVMMGYLKNEKATKECITDDGYFRSGDQGRLDQGRFLKITGRIKELIITAGGENVAPVPIEDAFKLECPACSNIMLVGENQRFMAALITFKVDIDMKTGLPSMALTNDAIKFFKDNAGVDVKTSEEAVKSQKIFELVQKCVVQCNKKLVSKAAHIKKFKLLAVDFSMPGGELTPTMKLKRKVTETKYKKEVDELYAVEAKM